MNRNFFSVASILCLGAFLWGLSTGIVQQDTWKPVTPQVLPNFQVLVFHQGNPQLVKALAVPAGSTFFVEASQERALSATLQNKFGTHLRIQQRSSSRAEHEIILETEQKGGIAKFYYRASRDDITPLGWSWLDSSVLGPGVTRGLTWALAILAVWSLLFFFFFSDAQES